MVFCSCSVLSAIIIVIVLKIIYSLKLWKCFQTVPIPKFESTWWGVGDEDRSQEENVAKPFTISIDNKIIDDLKQRLNSARTFTSPLEGIQQQYGMNTRLLSDIVEFWRTKYNWSEREEFLNKFPQFTIRVQGLRIHFIHVKPTNIDGHQVIPLLLLHGWPGSVREFYDIIPLLTTPRQGKNFVFEVIAPSLPGYGFSEAAARPGLGAVQMAVVFKNLMSQLGFDKYCVQGGDWGAIIATNMSILFPDHIRALHSNMCSVNTRLSNFKTFLCSYWPSLIVSREHESKMYPLKRKFSNLLLETGYFHLQATKPDTVGVALNDSPVGLAAYIIEKFTTWTNPEWKRREDGGLTEKYSYTSLLDNVMIYWVTGSITTSMRLYAETFSKAHMRLGVDQFPITVPTACARFSYELVYQPTSLLKEKYKHIVHESDHDGGHFAAFEVPNILANDIYEGIEKIELFQKSLMPN